MAIDGRYIHIGEAVRYSHGNRAVSNYIVEGFEYSFKVISRTNRSLPAGVVRKATHVKLRESIFETVETIVIPMDEFFNNAELINPNSRYKDPDTIKRAEHFHKVAEDGIYWGNVYIETPLVERDMVLFKTNPNEEPVVGVVVDILYNSDAEPRAYIVQDEKGMRTSITNKFFDINSGKTVTIIQRGLHWLLERYPTVVENTNIVFNDYTISNWYEYLSDIGVLEKIDQLPIPDKITTAFKTKVFKRQSDFYAVIEKENLIEFYTILKERLPAVLQNRVGEITQMTKDNLFS